MYNVKDYSFIYNNAVRSVRLNILCIMLKIIALFIITLFAPLYARIGILLTRGKHLLHRIISLRGKVWAHITSLTPSTFYWSVCTKPEHWCCGYIFCLYAILIFDFRIGPTVSYFFFFSFINTVAFFFPLCDYMVVNFISTDVIGAYHLKRMRVYNLTLPVLFCIALLVFWPWCCLLLRYTDSDYPFWYLQTLLN